MSLGDYSVCKMHLLMRKLREMIHLTNITKQSGSRTLFAGGDLQINPTEKIGLVGPNGAGKTTIFRIITGETTIDDGIRNISDKLTIGYFSQDVAEMSGRTALQEVMAANPRINKISDELKRIEKKLEESATNPLSDDDMAKLLENYGDLQTKFEQMGGYDLETRAQEILTGLGIGPEDYNRMTETFSGGWKMRIQLAKILTLNPDVLLMDEPTNHLDVESIIWLEEWIKNFKGSLLMTSHDREFMNRIVTRIVEIAHQKITSFTGNYDFYEREREIRNRNLVAAFKRQQEMMAKEEEFIARFAARASHAAQVQSRVKKLDKIDKIELPPEEQLITFQFTKAPRSGDEAVKFETVTKIWKKEDGAEKFVFGNASGLIRRMDKVAVVGVNGAGKSTFLKMIAGHTEPTSGRLTIGSNIHIGYFSQNSLDVLDPSLTVFQEVESRIPKASVGTIKSLLGAFKFSGDESDKKVSVLSGGEKSRLLLATILANPVNLLILDEPTNHLDIGSREVLLDALKSFEGTIIMVSHDRYFLKAIATRVFEIDRQQMLTYEGDYNYYLWKRTQH